MKLKKLFLLSITFAIISSSLSAFALPTKIEFSNLRKLVEKNNLAVKSAQEAVNVAEGKLSNYSDPSVKIYNTLTALELSYEKELEKAQAQGLSQETISAIKTTYDTQITQLRNSLGESGAQMDQYATTYENAKNTLISTIDSQLKTAQNHFINDYSLAAQIDSAANDLKIANAQKAQTQILVKYGRTPRSDLDSVDTAIESAKTSIENLKSQKELNLMQLKASIGLPLITDIELGKLPDFDLSEIGKIVLYTDIQHAFTVDENVKNAHNDLDNLSKGYEVAGGLTKNQAQTNLDKAKSDLQIEIKTSYNDLIKTYKQLQADQKNLTDSKTKLKTMELQYKLGKISKYSLQSQIDKILTIECSITASKLSLQSKLLSYKQLIY